jgi:MOSC domain-containing protein YiiM
MKGTIVSINISDKKGVRKTPIESANLIANFGMEGDAHATEGWHRQVSLLALESIVKMQEKGADVVAGNFAENLTTEGIDLLAMPLGTKIRIGDAIEGEISQIGKTCHKKCAIYYQAGDCVMPKEGIFINVLSGGTVKVGDTIEAQ